MSKGKLDITSAAGIAAGVAIGAVAVGAAAVAVGSQCLQIVRTRAGVARVKMIRGEQGERVRVLQQGGVFQSATYLDERRFEPVFSYCRAFDAMFEAEPAMRELAGHGIERVLMLGGGGFSYPKHALSQHPELTMDVVEIDPGIVRIARRWFFLDELERKVGERLNIHTEDARIHLAEAANADVRYDVIVNDCFSGANPVCALATVEALRQVKECLRPGGLYLANVVSENAGCNIEFLRNTLTTAAIIFSHVAIIPCEDEVFGGEDNYLLVASDASYDFSGCMPFDEALFSMVLHDDDSPAS